MANIKLIKDDHSFYIMNLLDVGERISYDWTLSGAYSVIVGKGKVSIGTDITASKNITALGLYKISSGEKLICDSIENNQSIFVVPFLLDDDVIMNELVPNSTTLDQLRNSSSYLMSFDFENYAFRLGPQESYDAISGNITLSISDINAKILEGLLQ